jgi:hypothetical protein
VGQDLPWGTEFSLGVEFLWDFEFLGILGMQDFKLAGLFS